MEKAHFAKITLNEHQNPYSQEYDDIYFASADGTKESSAIFLEGALLFNNWDKKATYCIGETGFGTGLNFLITWENILPTQAKLHFISIEKHPISLEQLKIIHQKWQRLSSLSRKLLAEYNPTLGGVQTIELDKNVKLTLLYQDVKTACPNWQEKVDAWYLDGFAPEKNPSMWSPELWACLSKNSQPNATFATFTASYKVQLGLFQAGFLCVKDKGWGDKRKRLRGEFNPQKVKTAFLPYLNKSLMEAAQRNATEEIQAYLNAGANPNFKQTTPYSALEIACKHGHFESLQLLASQTSIPSNKASELIALGLNHTFCIKIVGLLDKSGIDFTYQDKYGNFLVHLSTKQASTEFLDFWIAKKQSLELRSKQNWLPIHNAASSNNIVFVKKWLSLRPQDTSAQDVFNRTPLFLSTKGAFFETTAFLYKLSKSEAQQKDINKTSPCDLAQQKMYTNIFNLFNQDKA